MADKNDRVGCALNDDVTDDSSSLSTIGTATGDEIGCGVGFDVEGGGATLIVTDRPESWRAGRVYSFGT